MLFAGILDLARRDRQVHRMTERLIAGELHT